MEGEQVKAVRSETKEGQNTSAASPTYRLACLFAFAFTSVPPAVAPVQGSLRFFSMLCFLSGGRSEVLVPFSVFGLVGGQKSFCTAASCRPWLPNAAASFCCGRAFSLGTEPLGCTTLLPKFLTTIYSYLSFFCLDAFPVRPRGPRYNVFNL